MVRKGLSYEEKRKRMLEYFYENTFRLKDLEKQLPKQKGIVSQSVKEVLQSLCDDGLVDSDKIGSGNFFWAFPSKAVVKRQNKTDAYEESIAALEKEEEELQTRKRKALEGREESEERSTKLRRLETLEQDMMDVDTELGKYRDSDPEVVAGQRQLVKDCQAAANRWTDSIFNILGYIRKLRPELQNAAILQNFGLPADFDYIE